MEEIDLKTITAECSICGYEEDYVLDDQEFKTLIDYYSRGREMGLIQNLFPKVPVWIRSGAIDQYSGGFCICPKCSGM